MKRIYYALAVCAALVLLGCGSAQDKPSPAQMMYNAAKEPNVIEPQSSEEQQTLDTMDEFEEGQSKTIGKTTVSVVRIYNAASGHLCKAITLKPAATPQSEAHRVACHMENAWFFVPDVTNGSH